MAALVSAFESASRFKGVDKIQVQATISIYIVALNCRIFSLIYLLIDYAFGATIRIAYGNPDGGSEDGRDGAHSAVKSGSCCAAKTIPFIKPLALRVLQHPLRPTEKIRLNQIDHRVQFTQRKWRPWSADAD